MTHMNPARDRLVTLCKAFADPTRLRILALLDRREELCVCEIVEALGLPQYSVSRHLGVLKAAGVVTDWRQGKWMHYALDPGLSAEDRRVVAAVCARAGAGPAAGADRRRLTRHLRPRRKGDLIACR